MNLTSLLMALVLMSPGLALADNQAQNFANSELENLKIIRLLIVNSSFGDCVKASSAFNNLKANAKFGSDAVAAMTSSVVNSGEIVGLPAIDAASDCQK